ncbi:hypothetical protein EVA_14905 [gut metagenome]|uniref:Uncharacterized protein n=1 Tax=gut metagenome TaxID=749906 RepID=J9FPV9_9ZZZZ
MLMVKIFDIMNHIFPIEAVKGPTKILRIRHSFLLTHMNQTYEVT